MLAIVAAAIFTLALLFELAKTHIGDVFTASTLLMAGLICLALYLAGLGGGVRGYRTRLRR
jgi:hypothetical protein